MRQEIKLGKRILNKVFGGNPFKQLSEIRKDNIDNDIILDLVLYKLVVGYERIYTEEEFNKALQNKIKVREIDYKISTIIDKEQV